MTAEGVATSDLLTSLNEAAVELVRAERGFMVLASEVDGELEVEVEAAHAYDRGPLPRDPAQLSRSALRRCLSRQRAVVTCSASDADLKQQTSLHREGVLSVLCVPIEQPEPAASRLLYVDHRFDPDAFTLDDASLLQVYSTHAGQALLAQRELRASELEESLSSISCLLGAASGTVRRRPAKRATRADLGLVLATDQPLIQTGLETILGTIPEVELLEVVSDAGELLGAASRADVQLAIVDADLPDAMAMDAIQRLACRKAALGVLVVSSQLDTYLAERFIRAGALGFSTTRDAPSDLREAVLRVGRGERHVSNRLAGPLLDRLLKGQGSPVVESLSNRELQVFQLVGQGRSTKQIAAALHISVKTVEAHKAHIKRRLGLQDATELLYQAVLWTHRAPRTAGDASSGLG